jgi:hypothetical protein
MDESSMYSKPKSPNHPSPKRLPLKGDQLIAEQQHLPEPEHPLNTRYPQQSKNISNPSFYNNKTKHMRWATLSIDTGSGNIGTNRQDRLRQKFREMVGNRGREER